ncbi:tubulin--tyrosine ligase-like protein 12 isoform X1 [Ornithodoros turicata]|uniref:tubulin--tyrosine ligase-like protein 12 isoform X1 n=1 Tax=Ornithodoros turicata TaxID=34597 RepID=UPI00313A42F9
MPSKDSVSDVDKFIFGHRNQLETSAVPQHLWEPLYNKLEGSVFDAGEVFQIVEVQLVDDDDCDGESPEGSSNAGLQHTWKVIVIKEHGLAVAEDVYLIDHAWTYRPHQAKEQLQQVPGLLKRMAALMDVAADVTVDNEEEVLSNVLERMWLYNQTYSVGGPRVTTEDSAPIWYVMDEFGSRIQHSREPSFRCVPFYYLPHAASYSLLFPIREVPCAGEVTRNFAEGPPCDRLTEQALLLPWEPCDMTSVDCNQREPSLEYFRSGRKEESMPDRTALAPAMPSDRPLKVFSEYRYINEYLKHPAFEFTDKEHEADVLWLNYHYKNYRELSRETGWKRVNQFPFEHVVTVKDLLAVVCRRAAAAEVVDPGTLETSPSWLPTTYNLKTELPMFVSYFQLREKRGLDNHWICKPWNLARSLDTHVTNSLNCILRQPATGPKIVCKYISDPVLFPREDVGLVKFDFRYIVLLTSVEPLQLYAYKNFWLRFANKPFALDDYEDYEKHFTVMNYADTDMKQMLCAEFVEKFDDAYPSTPWSGIQEQVFGLLRSAFEQAASSPPPGGICPNPQSRAMYAVDLMIEWDTSSGEKGVQPKLLEVNWAPDCQRACLFYPSFFDDVFSTLFLDEPTDSVIPL